MIPEPDNVPCPPEVADALLRIMRESILLIRQSGNADDADWCAIEANHIHNLPSLVRSYSRDRLERYLTWAQTQYADNFVARFQRPPTMYLEYWQRLEACLNSSASKTPEN